MYEIWEMKELLERFIIDPSNPDALVASFYEMLDYGVLCDDDRYLVEAHTTKLDDQQPERMCLSLTRQMVDEKANAYWQLTLALYFHMNPYYKRFRIKPKGTLFYLTFVILQSCLNIGRHTIWATSEKKMKQIERLIQNIVRHGEFESYQIYFDDVE